MWAVVVFVFTYFLHYVAPESIPFKSCKHGNTIFSVQVTPCNSVSVNDWETCVLLHGTLVEVNAVFIAPFSSSNLETMLTAIAGDRVIAVPDSGTNPCKGSFIPTCPITKGKMYIFNRYYDIQQFFPTGPMEIRFAIRDKKSKEIMGCAKVPVVVDKNPKLKYGNSF